MLAITAKHPPASQSREGTRASVAFPADVYTELERIAGEMKVSVAWVVRDAVEKFVEARSRSSGRSSDSRTPPSNGKTRPAPMARQEKL